MCVSYAHTEYLVYLHIVETFNSFIEMLAIQFAVCYFLASCVNEVKTELTSSWNDCTYIVTPNGTCSDSSSIPCNTLHTYVQNASVYFVSNATFCFLSGRHIINETIAIRSVSNISLIGFGTSVQSSVNDKASQFNFSEIFPQDKNVTFLEPAAIIECKTLSGFLFHDINYLLLTNLTIMNCGANITGTLSYTQMTSSIDMSLIHYAAVLMINISNLHIEATSIQNSTGYGLVGINILGQSQITGSSFVGNNQFVKGNLQQYNPVYAYCSDGFNYITPIFFVNSPGKDMYAGGNALLIYDAHSNNSKEPILDISSCLFTLGVDGSIGLITTNEQNYTIVHYRSMGTGLGVMLLQTTYKVYISITNTVAYRNQASHGGNLNFQVNPLTFDIILTNVCSDKGVSVMGGGLYFTIIRSAFSGPSNNLDRLIVTNSAFLTDYKAANGIFISMLEWSFTIQFEKCRMFVNSALISLRLSDTNNPIIFNNTVFSAAGCSGGIGAYHTSIKVSNCHFNKYANVYGYESYIYIAESMFSNTVISALRLENSYLSLTGDISFMNNVVRGDGGALYLSYSDLTFIAPVNISFINNSASLHGGAIFIRKYIKDGGCSVIFNDSNGTLEYPGVHLSFEGNHAGVAGDVLYGGDIDACSYDCRLTPNYCSSSDERMLTVLNATTLCANKPCGNSVGNLTMISSDPRTICSCANSTIDCNSNTGTKRIVYPGQIIDIPIVTVGQLDGISPDDVLSITCDVANGQNKINCTTPSFSGEQQQTKQYCSNYRYQVKGKDNQLHLSAIHLLSKTAYSDGYGTPTYSMLVTVLQCPTTIGFVWNSITKMCSCSQILQKYDIQCDITTLTVFKTGTLWIGNSSDGILAVHTHCPYNYCKTNDTPLVLDTPDNQDEQCNYNHSGVLCGGCKASFSAVFGGARCKLCTNQNIWVLVSGAVLGVVMVILLFLLNCTVTMGTISPVILYANIVGPSILYLVPHNNHGGDFKTFLFVFINWLNLDFGIEACFYDGMDAYSKTWMELLFPLYILALVGAIIIGSRWSSKLAWLCKRNAVPVLATLILLLYANILQTVIEIFSYTQLDTGNPQSPLLWLSDGNVLYARKKHAYLFIAGLIITIAFIVPYTTILLVSPWLQARSQMRFFNWMNRLKPFIDAYQAPFKDRFRYWPGVHLMMRAVLYAVFITNQANDMNVNLLANAVVGCVYCGATNIFSVYKDWLLTILETFFVINLLCLSTSMLYIHNYTDGTIDTLIMTSTGSAFIVFIGIVAFHLYTLLKDLFNAFMSTRETSNRTVQLHQQEAAEVTPLLTSTRIARDSLIFDSHQM